MKKIFSLLVGIGFVLSMATAAYAVDGMEGGEQPQVPENQSTVTVETLDELEAAVAVAEDGDTIALSKCIQLKNAALTTDKNITLVPADSSVGMLFEMGKDSQLSGFTFTTSVLAVIISNYEGGITSITDCIFVGNENYYNFLVNISGGEVLISDCEFKQSKDIAVNISASSSVIVERCSFVENTTIMQGAGIHSMGECNIIDSSFVSNTAGIGGGIYSTGTLEISGCTYHGNKSTDSIGQDIVSSGTLTITDSQTEGEGYYDETTGEKVTLPLTDYTSTAKLIYLTDVDAAVYFAPPVEDENTDDQDDIDGENENPTETPTTPSEQPSQGGEDDTPTEQQPPSEQPEQPENGEDDSQDDTADDTDNEPTIIYKTVYVPVYIEREPESAEDPAPSLVCGDAVIDTSRSVKLEGYDDGLLHLEDGLTRAQFATILYRLLDDETIEQYDSTDTVFNDVAPDAWYCRTVTTIANAGIVGGTGNGNYSPDAPLTWAHIITVLSRFVEQEECELQNIQYDGWAVDAVETAVALGWIADHVAFNPDSAIRRGELAYFVNYVLSLYR